MSVQEDNSKLIKEKKSIIQSIKEKVYIVEKY